MITTRRTAVSDKDFEIKQNTIIEADFKTDVENTYVDSVINPLRADNPVITQRITPSSGKEDFMPTIKSTSKDRKVVSDEIVEESVATPVKVVDAKTKAVMVAYMSIAFILAIIVLATGIMITGRTAEVARLESDVRAAYNRVLGQEDTMEYLSDISLVGEKAVEMGMTNAGFAEEIELIPITEGVTYEERSNGFDRFCDFISGLIGG